MPSSIRVPMCMSDSMIENLVDVASPVTLQAIRDAAAKKFKNFKPKKGHVYHSVTGEELTDDIVASMFEGVGGAGVVLSGKEWKGAAKLRAQYATSSCAGAPALASDSAPASESLDVPCAELSSHKRAAAFLRGADAVMVLAGAGMGVDSGFDTFRSKDGSYTKEEYMSLARHAMFEEDPEAAWRWHGSMLERFRTVPPHDGYAMLLEICKTVGDYFVCSSNIDGAFLQAGFPSNLIFEAHGSVHMWQCVDSKCNRGHEPWPAESVSLDEGLPQCKHCGGLARPNVAFFDDGLGRNARSFNSRHIDPQKVGFTSWLRRLVARKVVIIELGCGVSEHSLRMTRKVDGAWACMSGEWKIPSLVCPLIRIDPGGEDHEADHGFVHIALGACVACTTLAEQMRSSFDRPQ